MLTHSTIRGDAFSTHSSSNLQFLFNYSFACSHFLSVPVFILGFSDSAVTLCSTHNSRLLIVPLTATVCCAHICQPSSSGVQQSVSHSRSVKTAQHKSAVYSCFFICQCEAMHDFPSLMKCRRIRMAVSQTTAKVPLRIVNRAIQICFVVYVENQYGRHVLHIKANTVRHSGFGFRSVVSNYKQLRCQCSHAGNTDRLL